NFTLTVIVEDDTNTTVFYSGSTTFSFVVENAPVVTSLQVSPIAQGPALSVFQVNVATAAYGVNGPYTFSLTFQQGDGDEQVLVTDSQSSFLSDVTLPSGQITLWAYATDLFGGVGRKSTFINITFPNANYSNVTCNDIQNAVQLSLAQSVAAKDYLSMASVENFFFSKKKKRGGGGEHEQKFLLQ
ncbi:hypothetical protein RFI_04362, partial [Reticulomyxa filosa]